MVFYRTPLKRFVERNPGITLDAYIDDLTLAANGKTEKEVEVVLVEAARDLEKVIKEELGCEIAKEKSAVVGSSEELARKIEEEKKDTKEEENADKQNASERINL